MEKIAFIVVLLCTLLSAISCQCPCNTGNGCNQNQNNCNQNQNNPPCGCVQNQNYNGGMMNTFGQPVSPACQGPLPCYDVVLSFIGDGPLRQDVINDEQDFLRVPSGAGMMRRDVLAMGRKGAAFFRDTYGVDFTSMPDTVFLSGRRMNDEGVEFRPFTMNPSLRYRMYTASTRAGTQLFNTPVLNQGWVLNFTRPLWGRGSFRKLIPARALAIYGFYTIHPCGMPPRDDFPRPCRNILNPQDPWTPIVITTKSPNYLQRVLEPYPFTPIDYILEHPIWGEGRGRAITVIRDLDGLLVDISMTLTFPSYK